MAGTVWDDVLGRIETKVNNYSFHTWFRHTSLLRDGGSSLFIRVVDPMAVEWMNKHYTGVIAEALAEVGRPGVIFSFVPEGAEIPHRPPVEPVVPVPDSEGSFEEAAPVEGGVNSPSI
jgi:chromosomal replication initiation ATPase DnaA